MNKSAFLLEMLVSGFFAIACLRSRAGANSSVALKPRDLLRLTDRLDRLRRTRWQWCSMVLVIIAVRMQTGVPLVVELTAALQFVVFLALPVAPMPQTPKLGRTEPSTRMASRQVRTAKAS